MFGEYKNNILLKHIIFIFLANEPENNNNNKVLLQKPDQFLLALLNSSMALQHTHSIQVDDVYNQLSHIWNR